MATGARQAVTAGLLIPEKRFPEDLRRLNIHHELGKVRGQRHGLLIQRAGLRRPVIGKYPHLSDDSIGPDEKQGNRSTTPARFDLQPNHYGPPLVSNLSLI